MKPASYSLILVLALFLAACGKSLRGSGNTSQISFGNGSSIPMPAPNAPLPGAIPGQVNGESLLLAPAGAYDSISVNATSATLTFVALNPVVLSLTGSITASHVSSIPENAGVRAVLSIDGIDCAADFSFESASVNTDFASDASCIRPVGPGVHILAVRDQNRGTNPKVSNHVARLHYTTQAAPGMKNSPVVAVESLAANGPMVSKTFTVPMPVRVRMAGSIAASFATAGIANAGIINSLSIDGVECASDLSFESYSHTVPFDSSASCSAILPPGTHTIMVKDIAAGSYPGMTNYLTRLDFEIIAVTQTRGAFFDSNFQNTASASLTLRTSVPIVIQVAASASSNTHSPDLLVKGGIHAILSVNGNPCSADKQFQNKVGFVTFRSAVTCIQALPPGTHEIKIQNQSAGLYPAASDYTSRLQVEILAR